MRIRKQLTSSIPGTPPPARRLPPLPREYSARGPLHSSVSDDSRFPKDAIPAATSPPPPPVDDQLLLPPIPKVEEEIVGSEMIKVEESMSGNFGRRATANLCVDRPKMEVKEVTNNMDVDGDVMRCKRNDGMGWRCKRDAALPSTLCSHHLAQSRSSELRRRSARDQGASWTATGTSRGKSSNKRHRISVAATGSGSDCYYYYSSFGPRRRKGRGEDQKGKMVVAEAKGGGEGSRDQVQDDGGCAGDSEERMEE